MLRNKYQISDIRYLISDLNNKIRLLNFNLLLLLLVFVFCGYSFADEQFLYDSKGRRNPFIPLVTSDGRLLSLDREEAQEGLLIEGIIYDKGGRSYAIVNGSIVGVNDTIEDYRVLKIEQDRIILIKDGQIKIAEMEMNRETDKQVEVNNETEINNEINNKEER